MVLVMEQATWAVDHWMEQDMALLPTGKRCVGITIRAMLLALMVAGFWIFALPAQAADIQEKEIILSGSGIYYPKGYDMNTVGEISGVNKGLIIPDSGPVRLKLTVDKETYFVLTSPAWFWKDQKITLAEGAGISVRGSKALGKDGSLYIIAQEIKIISSNQSVSFRSDSGDPLWSKAQMKKSGSRGALGSSTRGGGIGGSSRMGRGRGGR